MCRTIFKRVFLAIALSTFWASQAVAANQLALSPDGNRVAFTYRNAVWIVSTESGSVPEKILDAPAFDSVPRWSPDGSTLAFYSNESGSRQIWLFDIRSRRLHRLTNVEGGINPFVASRLSGFSGDPFRFSWSPDGSMIVFSSEVTQPATPTPNVSALSAPNSDSLAAGRPVVLTKDTPPEWTLYGVVSYSHVNLSDNLGSVRHAAAPTAPVVRATQLFIIQVATGRIEQITHDLRGYFTPEWSPDGRTIAYMSSGNRNVSRSDENTDIFLLDIRTSAIRRVTENVGQKSLPRWSPDGRKLAYYCQLKRAGFVRIEGRVEIVDVGSGVTSSVQSIDRGIQAFEWSQDGAGILMTVRDGLNTPLIQSDPETGAWRVLTPAPFAVAAYGSAFAANSSGMAWIGIDDPNGPNTLYIARASSEAHSVLDISPEDDLSLKRRVQEVHWTNSRGEVLDGLVVYPMHYSVGRRYPLVVDPYGMASLDIYRLSDSEPALFRDASDYIIFRPNHRAPQMWINRVRSAVWDAAAVGPNGISQMVDDILTGVGELERRGLVDAGRACLVGFSNGAMEALQIISETNAFSCAVIQSPSPGDWITHALINYPEDSRMFMYGILPWEDPDIYVRLSPVFNAPNIETPILLSAGDREPIVLATIEIYNALKLLGRDITLIRYPGQGHGYTGSAESDFSARVRAFLQMHLANDGSTQ